MLVSYVGDELLVVFIGIFCHKQCCRYFYLFFLFHVVIHTISILQLMILLVNILLYSTKIKDL